MHPMLKSVILALFSLMLTACASKGEQKADESAASVTEAGANGAEGQGAGREGSVSDSALDDPSSPLSKRVIYFDYDSSEVRSEDREVLAAHAQYVAKNPSLTVTLEGHADERGSREYNIGLGEQRAQTVRNQMTVQGVLESQIKTLSYGEEKPASDGHDDWAWQQNRRVEIVYPGR